jgi:glucose/arabinose dehydrogenase
VVLHEEVTMRPTSILISLAATAALTMPALAGAPLLETELVVSGLNDPTYVAHAPGDADRLFVAEQGGAIRLVTNGVLQGTPFLDLAAIVPNETFNGLLGLAFHPDYETNGWFYVQHPMGGASSNRITIARYTVSANPNVADAGSRQDILVVNYPALPGHHVGGWIGFGPDGHLYVGLGDGHTTGGEAAGGARSQSLASPWGKMLRLDVNGADDFPADANRNYGIPGDNPFVGQGGDEAVWVRGLRQPFRSSFDRETGDLWITDVGRFAREEINVQPASSIGGENYGWNCAEGALCTTNANCTCGAGLTDPIHDYSQTLGCTITGGAVYRGCAIDGLQGTYFYADYCSNRIWSFRHDGGAVLEFEERTGELSPAVGAIVDPVAIGEDYYGELLIVCLTGSIYRITPKIPPADDDGDGIPNACEESFCAADMTGPKGAPDGNVDSLDFLRLIAQWGSPCTGTCDADITGPGDVPDGNVDSLDYLLLIAQWGSPASCPSP